MTQNRVEKSPVDHHVGSRIRMRRMMLGMSQGKLGDALGVSFQQVQKYEFGTNRVSASRLQNVSEVLQVPVTFFFQGLVPEKANHAPSSGTAPPHNIFDELMTTRDGLTLAKAFMKIGNVQLRRRIVALAEEIADGRS